ncbi:MAG: hypothetical protein WC755_08395 [Candidatus Woesearchaeota archaeon]|jgi:hypothetical protein
MYILNILLIVLLLPIGIAALSIAPWMPMKSIDLERIHKLANLKKGQFFYEIGFGDSRVCRYIAMKNPYANIVGIEMAWPLYLFSKIKNWIYPISNLTLIYGNAFKINISKADVVYTFAMQKSLNFKLKEKFLKELKKGSKIISYAFYMYEWKGEKSIDKPSKKGSMTINVYRV